MHENGADLIPPNGILIINTANALPSTGSHSGADAGSIKDSKAPIYILLKSFITNF